MIEGARKIRLELAADWLVMAAWLTWLKSRLLVPALGEPEDAETAAETLAARLVDLQAVRAAAAWMGKRPQLGWDEFARGIPEEFTETDRSRLRLEMSGLLSAYLAARRRAGAKLQYRPKPMAFHSVQNALERLQAAARLDAGLVEPGGVFAGRAGGWAATPGGNVRNAGGRAGNGEGWAVKFAARAKFWPHSGA